MSSAHLTEEIIQAYALRGTHEDPHVLAHIHACETCRAAAESYARMFSALEEMPAATFDFDVKELVLPKLRVRKRNRPALVPVLATIFGLLALGGAGYYFSDYLGGIIGLSLPYLLYCLGPAAVTLLVILAVDMFNSHRQKMEKLEYY